MNRDVPAILTPRRTFLKQAGLAAGLAALPAGLVRTAAAQDPFVHQLGWIKSIQFGGHFAAIHNGYFEEEGIAADFLAGGPGTDAFAMVATGRATTSDSDVVGVVRARASGIPVKAFAAIMQRAPGAIMSLAASPITSIEDFPGKTIAMPDGIRPQVAAVMRAAGLDPDSVNYVPVGTDPGMLAAGQVDGYYGWATNQGVMLRTRGVDIHVAYMNDLGVPGYAGVLFATDETLETRRDLVVRWLRAEIRGWEWHLANPEEMARLMVEQYGQRGLDLAAQTAESLLMEEFVPVGDAAQHGLLWVEPEIFARGMEFAVVSGTMEAGAVAVEDVVTQDLIREAHGLA